MTSLKKKQHFNSTNVRINSLKQKGTNLMLSMMWRWVPGYTQDLVHRMFFSPNRPIITKTQTEILVQANAGEWRLNDKNIKYWSWGDGPAILLAHGWNGRSVSLSRFIDPLVKAGHKVVAFDAPAHGESEGTTTSYFEYTDVMRSFIDPNQGLNIAGIIGHSFGGAATINSLAKEQLNLPAVLIAPALKLKEVLEITFDSYGIPSGIYQHIISGYEKKYGYHLASDNPIHLLPAVPGPIFIVHDQDDHVIAYEDSQEAVKACPTVRLHSTTGLGHKQILADENVIDLSLSFLDAHATDRHVLKTRNKTAPV